MSRGIRIRDVQLWFLPVEHRIPLKFGSQTVWRVTCARVRVVVEDERGYCAEGWGETPLSVAWVWPSSLSWEEREQRMRALCVRIARELPNHGVTGHPMELGDTFQIHRLHALLSAENAGHAEAMPHLAALVCHSPFDLAAFDAFANLHDRPVFSMLGGEFLQPDLSEFLDGDQTFAEKRPDIFLRPKQMLLPVWHLVGGLDALEESDLTGDEPHDGYPVLLREWIRTDGLRCLKIKLRGTDAAWDYDRLVRVGNIAAEEGVDDLSADFNCTVTDPAYVCEILDRLAREHPRIFSSILYIEQPFPYDLEANRIDVRSVTERRPLFLDESAHDWRFVRLGCELGWDGVALKTCKTLTGALLSLAWARAKGMRIMVQDLTNTMLAQIPHVSFAAHAGTLRGVESNGMQFSPKASAPEARIHPGLYSRRGGVLDLSTLGGRGFGYRISEIGRELGEPAASSCNA
jgi:L-alanine-DL-glutamate epimerase-like enolase superfamily enzyme